MQKLATQAAATALPALSATIIAFPVTRTPAQRFRIMCAHVQLLRAEYEAECARFALYRAQRPAAPPWWDDPRISADVDANNDRFALYRASVLTLAETRAPTADLAHTKRGIIGKVWLRAEGCFYDRLRAGVAADGPWLPKRRRA